MSIVTPLEVFEDFITISVKFENSDAFYTYKCPKSFNVKLGDTVVVKSPNGSFKCVSVKSVHETPRPDSTEFKLKWIVQKVNPGAYNTAMLELEKRP